MKILLLSDSFNGMTQKFYLHLALKPEKHVVICRTVSDAANMVVEVNTIRPDVIMCPFLTKKIPSQIYDNYKCIIVHPGPLGDRGPSSIDWALKERTQTWGVTLLQAVEEMDAGAVYSSKTFIISDERYKTITKSSFYRNECLRCALDCLDETLDKLEKGIAPTPQEEFPSNLIMGRTRPFMKQSDRRIADWNVPSEEIAFTIRCSDSSPGVLDTLFDRKVFLYGAHAESQWTHNSPPKTILGKKEGAILLACNSKSAIWITHLKLHISNGNGYFKVPATQCLEQMDPTLLNNVPELSSEEASWNEVRVESVNQIAIIHFEFMNGAQSVEQCKKLEQVIKQVGNDEKYQAIVLLGGHDFFSNGIHLNSIEAAEDPEEESMKNIKAIDDVVYAIMNIPNKLTVSAFWGNGGAGGVMMAMAADRVIAHDSITLNPHYKTMGLFGSEYWTHNLSERLNSEEKAWEIVNNCRPYDPMEFQQLGLIDRVFEAPKEDFPKLAVEYATKILEESPNWKENKQQVGTDEWKSKVEKARSYELHMMEFSFSGRDYATSRHGFVHKKAGVGTPPHVVALPQTLI